jgi:hypothetical protein
VLSGRVYGDRTTMKAGEQSAREAMVAEAEYREDDLAGKLIGFLACRPETATRADVTSAMHEWLKSQLALLGVPTIVMARVGSEEDTGCHARAGKSCQGFMGEGCRHCGRLIGTTFYQPARDVKNER